MNMLEINNPSSVIRKMIFFFFFYMIIEGVIRKWVLPSFSTQIYFIKDILLIIIYLFALKYNFIFKSIYSKIFIIFVIIISLYGFIGYDFDRNGIISYILGLRSYWLFLPIFLIIAHTCDKDDLVRFFHINLYLILPYFLLIYFQSIFPEISPLNSGYDGTLLSPERPSGYFTYTTQNTYYFLFLFFSFCCFVLDKKEFFKRDIIFLSLLNFLLIIIMILLKSRAVYFYVLTTILYSTIFIIFSNFKTELKLKKILLIFLVSLITFNISSNFLVKKSFEHSKVRMNTDIPSKYNFVTENKDVELKIPLFKFSKNNQETITIGKFCSKYSTICRIINDLYIIPSMRAASLSGKGIGAGTKTVVVFNKIKKSFFLGEIDNKRVIIELGYIIGLLLVVIKMLAVIIFNIIALFKYRDEHKLLYVPIVVFISTQLLLGTVSYSTSFISFIFWFSLGLLFLSFNKKNI